jgi:hypothetical protein
MIRGIFMANNYADSYDGIATGAPLSAAKMTAALNTREAALPAGTILAMSVNSWVNAGAAFQSKWRVCDGTGGTPNLSGRFLRGGTSNDAATGGANSVILSKENLPAHNHGSNTGNAGKHRHNLTVVGWYNDLGVSGYQYQNSVTLEGKYIGGYRSNDMDSANTAFAIYMSCGQSKRIGTENISEVADHTHSITSEGSGNSFSILPSYYTVIYIMKVA